MKLLFHHHTPLFRAPNGAIMGNPSIVLWLNAIQNEVTHLGILFFETDTQLPFQSAELDANIEWISLGTSGDYLDYFSKRKRIKNLLKVHSANYDILLIRGLTPKQKMIWKNSQTPSKAFLMVRGLHQKRQLHLSPISWLAYLVNWIREREFRQILQEDKAHFLANSIEIANEIKMVSGKEASFVSTNVISEKWVKPFYKKSLDKNQLKLLFVGRVNPLKGMSELLEAFHTLGQTYPSIQLDIVGPYSENYKAKLLQGLNTAEQARVNWHGQVDFGEPLLNFYKQASIFILPSYTEGFPRVYWEAALSSCPTLLTPVGGIPSILQNKKHSLFIAVKNSNSIVEMVHLLVKNDILVDSMTQSAYRIAKDYLLEPNVKTLIDRISK